MTIELRPYGAEDLALTAALEADPEVKSRLGGAVGADEAGRIHERRMAAVARGDWYFTIHVTGAPRPAGVIAIFRTPWEGGHIHEVGSMLFPEFQAQGIAAEAFRMLVERGRHERRFTEIHGFAEVSNGPSNGIVRRLGFELLGECDMDYEGVPIRCNHWRLTITRHDGTGRTTG
ncbi:GNAT family N-acetyltransferase [Dactylosporangium sp. AC04546]|uniref:GNAT family N-acetyltransferase n=1 Tax=Dactylosporangium sp. AC04546 TaxID=2862460 RepID=UPI001EDDE33F|nr:GNAT family N-acetyltransferase [Dactylosporangium sp. AC04546]WVK87998.1 GNAT family N-acetyltransferase [Dactylosporangium sp. AC04546]